MAVMDARNMDHTDLIEAAAQAEISNSVNGTAAADTRVNVSSPAQSKPLPKTGARMSVRLVEPRDRAALHNLLVQHHANTEFRAQPFSPWKFNQNFDHVVSRPPRNVGMVVELGDVVIGVAWASADSYMLSDGPLFCTVQLIAVELEAIGPLRRAKAFLALVAGIRQWAASMNASHSFIHVTTGSNLAATDRLMKAAGARTVGGAYVV
jgi:hypothetical protein